MLEALPVELFRGIASYLSFLDRKALSITSQKCNAMTGVYKCPDPLTWLIYLRRSPAKLQGPLLDNPGLFGDLIFSLREYLEYQNGTLISPKAEIEELISPYFPPKSFPKSTLLYYYMTVARDFSAYRNSDAAGLSPGPLSPRYYWDPIESESMCVIRRLDRMAQKTDAKRRAVLPRSA